MSRYTALPEKLCEPKPASCTTQRVSAGLSFLDFKLMMAGRKALTAGIEKSDLTIAGDSPALTVLAALLRPFERRFPSVMPRPDWH
tara:strand:+ start:191 stop:448 length:258 start_codon:yes stop_codon:yes gene_type:complete